MNRKEIAMGLDEIRRLAANGQYRRANRILEDIQIKKVKEIKDLYLIVDVLVENEKYIEARDVLISISKKVRGRRVYHQLVAVCIKARDCAGAKKYRKEFSRIAPEDPYNYIFEYEIEVLEGNNYARQIEILEQLKQREYVEKWAYELAKAYQLAGRKEDCISECDHIILMFGEGDYVEKAKTLKKYLCTLMNPKEPVVVPVKEESEDIETVQNSIWQRPKAEEPRVEAPIYQSAFDFIEDMELKEQEEELDRIIERANQRKAEQLNEELQENQEVSQKFEPEEDQVAEEDNPWAFLDESSEEGSETEEIEQIELEPEVEEKIAQPYAEEESELEDVVLEESLAEEMSSSEMTEETVDEPDTVESLEVEAHDEPDEIATDSQVRRLVEETQESIVAQMMSLFYEEEVESEDAESEAAESLEKIDFEEPGLVEPVIVQAQDVPEIPEQKEPEAQSEAQAETQPELHSEKNETTEPAEESEETPHTVSKSVDRMIRKRRQMALVKQINDFIWHTYKMEVSVQEYLGQFAKNINACEGVLKSLETMQAAHNTNVILCLSGQSADCMTNFARRFAKLLIRVKLISSQKFLVLPVSKFETIDFNQYIDQIRGGSVVVEQVKEVTQILFRQIKVLEQAGCQVMLEIQNEQILTYLEQAGQVVDITIGDFEAEDLAGFAIDYLEEKEYSIEPEALKYLEKYTNELVTSKTEDAFCKVLEIITKAYHCAKERNKVELRNIAELGNYQDATFMNIKYCDFANEN